MGRPGREEALSQGGLQRPSPGDSGPLFRAGAPGSHKAGARKESPERGLSEQGAGWAGAQSALASGLGNNSPW